MEKETVQGLMLVVASAFVAFDWFALDGKWRLTPLLVGLSMGIGLTLLFTV